ncbi:hypothetical protein L3X38_016365 [Prunus dulcis]|uniref:Mitochondrial substrate carrier family protein n=1 Tax=Prunus dulcis TaxID=3755 RepID=A0AAD4W7Q0_PRUDU|nr:hypothetical protein L3X38_016365 [Prunus dulcis]
MSGYMVDGILDHMWQDFLASRFGKEFVAGGCGGIAGVLSGYPLDTLRVRQQHSKSGSAFSILRNVISAEGPTALYRGIAAPLASVTFQNAMVFQINSILCAVQSLILSPIELVKIRLQLQNIQAYANAKSHQLQSHRGPIDVAKAIMKAEGLRGIYRGLGITVLRDAPSFCFYFSTYEYMREKLHPGCRKSGEESMRTMMLAGGLAGVASWLFVYPLDVVKTRWQAQSVSLKYNGIVDCFQKSVREGGYRVLWRGLGTAVVRAFLVNGAIFPAYEIALRFLQSNETIPAVSAI